MNVFVNYVICETMPIIPVIICGSAAWHFTVATAFVCPDNVCTLAFVLTSQIYESTVNKRLRAEAYSTYFRQSWLYEFIFIGLQIKLWCLSCLLHPTVHHMTVPAIKFQGEQETCLEISRHLDNLKSP